MSRWRRNKRIRGVLVAGSVLVVDQAAKLVVTAMREELPVRAGSLRIEYVRNTGASFSLLQDHGWILAIVVSLVTVAVAALLARGPRQLAVALGVFLGGSLGNLIDRLRLGYVVDFIGIAWWPTFNVADIAIAVGAALIVLGFLRPRSS